MKQSLRFWFWDYVSKNHVIDKIQKIAVGKDDPAKYSFDILETTCRKVIVDISMPDKNVLVFWDDLTEELSKQGIGCCIKMELIKTSSTLRCRLSDRLIFFDETAEKSPNLNSGGLLR